MGGACRHLLIAGIFLGLQAGLWGADVKLADLTMPMPVNWTRTDISGAILLAPTGIEPRRFLVVLGVEPAPTSTSVAALAQRVETFWQNIGQFDHSRLLSHETDVGQPGRGKVQWIFRRGLRETAAGARLPVALAVVFRPEATGVVCILAGSEEDWQRYRPDLLAMLAGAALADGPSPASPAVAPSDANLGPPAGFGEKTSGVYLGVGTSFRPTLNTGLQISRGRRMIAVLPDGRWRSELPDQGLMISLAADQRAFPDRWGTWTTSGNQPTLQRMNETLVLDETWVRLPLTDGLLFDGRFVREDTLGTWGTSQEPELVLRRDGTFEDRSGLLRMVGSLVNFDGIPAQVDAAAEERWLAPGAGRYEVRNFTFIFRYNDGRVRRHMMYLPPGEDRANPRRWVTGSYSLVRK